MDCSLLLFPHSYSCTHTHTHTNLYTHSLSHTHRNTHNYTVYINTYTVYIFMEPPFSSSSFLNFFWTNFLPSAVSPFSSNYLHHSFCFICVFLIYIFLIYPFFHFGYTCPTSNKVSLVQWIN